MEPSAEEPLTPRGTTKKWQATRTTWVQPADPSTPQPQQEDPGFAEGRDEKRTPMAIETKDQDSQEDSSEELPPSSRAQYNRQVTTPSMGEAANLTPSSKARRSGGAEGLLDDIVNSPEPVPEESEVKEETLSPSAPEGENADPQESAPAEEALPQRQKGKRDKSSAPKPSAPQPSTAEEITPAPQGKQTFAKGPGAEGKMAAGRGRPAEGKGPQNNSNGTHQAGRGQSNNAKGPQGNKGSVLPAFSSSVIPRDHRRFNPQGWVQAEFSEVSNESARNKTKEEIRRLEMAWQMRIDLDMREADKAEQNLMKSQESLGVSSATLSRISKELKQQSDLLAPFKKKLKAALDEREKCFQVRTEVREADQEIRKGPRVEEMDRMPREVQRLLERGTVEDAEVMVRAIEEEFETNVMGSEDRYTMLGDKPNISKTGLLKVTNDKTALLRAEKKTILRVQEIKKQVPILDAHSVKKETNQEKSDDNKARLKQLDTEISHARDSMADLNKQFDKLKKKEGKEREDYEVKVKERNALRQKVNSLRQDIRAELAERNKQRERYRYLVAQEREMQLRHELRQNVISGEKEEVLEMQREALREAAVAKEEAEAHARMLQASIARYDRLRSEVEGWEMQPDQTKKEAALAKAQTPTDEEDLGEELGIPAEGWGAAKRGPGDEVLAQADDLLKRADKVLGREAEEPQPPTEEEKVEEVSEPVAEKAKEPTHKETFEVEEVVEPKPSKPKYEGPSLDPDMEAELDEQLKKFREQLVAQKNATERAQAKKERVKAKEQKRKLELAMAESESEEELDAAQAAPLGREDPVFKAFLQEREDLESVSTLRLTKEERAERAQRRKMKTAGSRSTRTYEDDEPEEPVAPVQRKKKATTPDKKKKGSKAYRSDDEGLSDGEGFENVTTTGLAAAAKQAMEKRARKKEAERRWRNKVGLGLALSICAAALLFIVYHGLDPSPTTTTGGQRNSPAARSRMLNDPAFQQARPPQIPETKEEKELQKKKIVAQVPISNKADPDGNKLMLDIRHDIDDTDGLGKDVDLFMKKYGVPPEYKEQLVNAAVQTLQQVEGQSGMGQESYGDSFGDEDDEDLGEEDVVEEEVEGDEEEDQPPKPRGSRTGASSGRQASAEEEEEEEELEEYAEEDDDYEMPEARVELGKIKMKHQVDKSIVYEFPYYEDSTRESLTSEANVFARKHHIPLSQVSSIVDAAMRKVAKKKKA